MRLILRAIIPAVLICALFSVAARAAETDWHRTFVEGINAYEAKHYTAAREAFQKIVAQGVHNGKLYYDLGNASLKSKKLGEAILWYERARKRIPNDPDLMFNLTYARSLVRDQSPDDGPSLYRIVFFWRYHLNPRTIQWLALGLNLVFWGLMALGIFFKRRIPRPAAGVVLALALIFTATAGFNAYDAAFHPQGIILSPAAPVRSGITKADTELFVLHAGTRVRIEKQSDGFVRIRFSADKIGWLPRSEVGII